LKYFTPHTEINLEREKRDQKEHATFRIDAKSLRRIEADATKNNISVNTLVNQILKKYAEWDADFECAGLISIWKIIPIRLLLKYSETEISQLAREVSDTKFKATIILHHGKFEVETFLREIENWMNACNYPYKHDSNFSTHKIMVQHGMGERWGLFTVEIWKATLEQLGVKKILTDVKEDSLTLEFDTTV